MYMFADAVDLAAGAQNASVPISLTWLESGRRYYRCTKSLKTLECNLARLYMLTIVSSCKCKNAHQRKSGYEPWYPINSQSHRFARNGSRISHRSSNGRSYCCRGPAKVGGTRCEHKLARAKPLLLMGLVVEQDDSLAGGSKVVTAQTGQRVVEFLNNKEREM